MVYLAGLEEETFPHIRSLDDPDQMEEERRLCYVGLTRAMERLFLSSASTRTVHGNTMVKKVSRFVEEIPEDLFKSKPQLGFAGTGAGSGRRRSNSWDDEGPAIGSSAWKGWGKSAPGRPRTPVGGPVRAKTSDLNKGDTVEHKVFGKGKVTDVGGGGDIITVDFLNGSVRKLKGNFLKKVASATPGAKSEANPAPKRPKDGQFQAGERVRHRRWGSDTVKVVVGDTLTVVFPGITVSLPQGDSALSY